MVYLLFFSVQALYGLLVLICVVVGAHLVKLNGTKPMVIQNHEPSTLLLLLLL
jgi:hypothetical protein